MYRKNIIIWVKSNISQLLLKQKQKTKNAVLKIAI